MTTSLFLWYINISVHYNFLNRGCLSVLREIHLKKINKLLRTSAQM